MLIVVKAQQRRTWFAPLYLRAQGILGFAASSQQLIVLLQLSILSVLEDTDTLGVPEYRERMAMEREWARKLNASQLESLQKIADMEMFAKAKAAEADQLAGNVLELEKSSERIRVLELADLEQKAASQRAEQGLISMQTAARVNLQTTLRPTWMCCRNSAVASLAILGGLERNILLYLCIICTSLQGSGS